MLSCSHFFWHSLVSLVFSCSVLVYFSFRGCSHLGLPVCFLTPYSVVQYIGNGARHDFSRLFLLPDRPGCLSIIYNNHARNSVVGAWSKRWKHWGGWGTSDYRTSSLVMDLPFFCCVEERGYQRRLTTVLADLWPGMVAPTVSDVAHSCFDEYCSQL